MIAWYRRAAATAAMQRLQGQRAVCHWGRSAGLAIGACVSTSNVIPQWGRIFPNRTRQCASRPPQDRPTTASQLRPVPHRELRDPDRRCLVRERSLCAGERLTFFLAVDPARASMECSFRTVYMKPLCFRQPAKLDDTTPPLGHACSRDFFLEGGALVSVPGQMLHLCCGSASVGCLGFFATARCEARSGRVAFAR